MKCMVIAALVVGVLAFAQGPSPLGLIPQPSPGLSVAIWTEKPSYYIGETARFFVYVSQPAYIYVFDIEPTGHIRLIFPNFYSPNPWKPAGTHVFPDGNYVFRVTPPSGTETLQVVACLQPIVVPQGTEEDPYPLFGPDPQSGRKQVLGLIPEQCGCCATAWTTFQILPGSGWYPCPPCYVGPCPPCPPPTPPCPWPCPGFCWYYDPACSCWRWVIGEPPGPGFYWCLGPDGQWRFHVRICFGDCD